MMAGVDMVHVPYRGVAPATTDLLGGRVQVLFDSCRPRSPYPRRKNPRARGDHQRAQRGAAGPCRRWPNLFPGFEANSFHGVAAPKGTPQEIVDKLNKDINAVLQEPKLKSRLADLAARCLPARLRTSAPMSRARSTNGAR